MSIQDTKPFVQVPDWQDDTEFTIKGREFRALYDLSMWLGPLLQAVQFAYQDNIKNGKIKVTYQYQDGSGEVPEEVWKGYFAEAKAQIEKMAALAVQEQVEKPVEVKE